MASKLTYKLTETEVAHTGFHEFASDPQGNYYQGFFQLSFFSEIPKYVNNSCAFS